MFVIFQSGYPTGGAALEREVELEDHKHTACMLHSELQWLHSNKTDQTAVLFFLTD